MKPRLRSVSCGVLWLALSVWIVWADYISTVEISFPVTYIVPVLFAANAGNRGIALALSIAMPFTRWRLEPAAPDNAALAACLIQSFVLGLIAILVDRQHQRLRTLRTLLRICAWCKRVHVENETWEPVEAYIQRRAHAELTHGVCPDCFADYEQSLEASPRHGRTVGGLCRPAAS